jgi:hypothetical protein
MDCIQIKTNFGHSRRRKKHIHKETKENFGEGGEECPPLPLWGTEFCLLGGDEDFVDDQPASKRMKQGCADYDCYGLSSDDEEEYLEESGQCGGHPARFSMGYIEEPVQDLR